MVAFDNCSYLDQNGVPSRVPGVSHFLSHHFLTY